MTDRETPELRPMKVSWLTRIGLFIAALGWAVLLGAVLLDSVYAQATPLLSPIREELAGLAKTAVLSGFGLAIIGSLHAGFGALNGFFQAVLLRSGQRAQSPPQAATNTGTDTLTPTPQTTRPYKIYPDGSVEVETIVGSRRFESIEEAREFL